MADRNVILTTVHRVGFDHAQYFLSSLQRTGYRGDIVMFASGMDAVSISKLRSLGVRVVPFHFYAKGIRQRLWKAWPLWRAFFKSPAPRAAKEKLAHLTFHLFYRRHLLHLEFLRKNKNNYDRVFLTDCRDVYFQADPFSWAMAPGIHFFLEDQANKIGDPGPHHQLWIESQYGPEVFQELKTETISCAGTVFGDVAGAIDYLSEMVAQAMNARSLREPTGDQGLHNYILRKKPLPRTVLHDNLHGPVMTLGALKAEDVRLNGQGLVVNCEGHVPPVLHQYDRIAHVEKLLLQRLKVGEP